MNRDIWENLVIVSSILMLYPIGKLSFFLEAKYQRRIENWVRKKLWGNDPRGRF